MLPFDLVKKRLQVNNNNNSKISTYMQISCLLVVIVLLCVSLHVSLNRSKGLKLLGASLDV